MREILFKAKRKNWKELPKEQWWVEGYLVKKLCGRYTTIGFEEFEAYVIVESFEDGGTSYAYIDESTLCQCTGLTDKNGRKIWENDIVLEVQPCKRTFKITYDVDAFCFDGHNIMLRVRNARNMVEVIGNVFDNPELLEKGAGHAKEK